MIGRYLRDIVNLLLYGGAFIGICAACLTALSFEIIGTVGQHLDYIFFVGSATAALYCGHRVIGLKKVAHIQGSLRFEVIRRYKRHIWLYAGIWTVLSVWFFLKFASIDVVFMLLPGSVIAAGYVLPCLPNGKRLRDLGWGKIVMIGWSWGWLTAFVPFVFFAETSFMMATVHGIERMLFIILITIPFEIRDMAVDQKLGLVTMPAKLGKQTTRRIAFGLLMFIFLLSASVSFQYLNSAYAISMTATSLLVIPIIKFSYRIEDDYFFGGLVDGLMIFVLVLFTIVKYVL